MSGEKSKKSGEIGEKLANKLLGIMGWKNTLHNISIECHTPTHLNQDGNRRISHGEDQIFLYHNPFHDDRTDIVHVSVKNHLGAYAKGQTLKTQFKGHLKELLETIECAKFSPELKALSNAFQSKKVKGHAGLLIWLQNDDSQLERGIISEISNVRLDSEFNTPVYVVDNARATFLLNVTDSLKRLSDGGAYEFYYPRIGTSLTVDENRRGKILPLELLGSDIIPSLIRVREKFELVVFANEKFNQSSYERMAAYGLNFGNGLVDKIHIGMEDFNPAQDQATAQLCRMAFHNRTEQILPFSFKRSILDLLGDD